MQTDPIGGADDLNLYAYVGNDSINGVDPTGERVVCTSVSSYDGDGSVAGQQGNCHLEADGDIANFGNLTSGFGSAPQLNTIVAQPNWRPTTAGTPSISCPVASPATILSAFGPRISPKPGASSYHDAIDFRNPLGRPVFATENGSVLSVNYNAKGGNQILVLNSNGSVSGYAHSMANVRQGAPVRSGQAIG